MESVSRDEHLRVGALARSVVRTRFAQALKVRCMGRIPYPNHARIQSPLARLSVLKRIVASFLLSTKQNEQ